MFRDRKDAGFRLAEELKDYMDMNVCILGIPRGGAVVAKFVSERLGKPMDIIVPRKIGAPFNKEIAIGALAQDGNSILNEEIINYYGIPYSYIEKEIKFEMEEIRRRLMLYRGSTDFPDVSGKSIILVDDGIATGFTIIAAIKSLRKHSIKKLVVAVPIAPVETIDRIARYADEVVCIEVPNPFLGVSCSYNDFPQNTDNEVIDLFKQENCKIYI